VRGGGSDSDAPFSEDVRVDAHVDNNAAVSPPSLSKCVSHSTSLSTFGLKAEGSVAALNLKYQKSIKSNDSYN
jgi:hypothetical protein